MYKVMALLVLVTTIVAGDVAGVQWVDRRGELVDAFALENGAAVVVLRDDYYGQVSIMYLFNDEKQDGVTFDAPPNILHLEAAACGGYVQVLGMSEVAGHDTARVWRYVWRLPEQVQEHYLPMICQ